MGGWRRPETLVIDIDSLPVEVHGEQPGSAWNGYYHRRVYHPIVAAAGETGRHPGPAAARGAGPHGGRRAGVRPRGAGAGGAASVREGRRALRRGISRRAADGGAGGAGHALRGPGAQQRRAEAPGAAGHGRRGLGCAEHRGARRRRAPHLGLRVLLPGRVVVPFPPGRAGRRRAAGRTHPALLLAADFDAVGGDVRRGTSWRCTANAARRRAIWGS